ncbi:MAG: T9SS type A sorting domain-containing protein, partial [Flavobacteriaceae bacterium]|nr:T9SS type A sorting domain-containing protein [Flavobacteriaceae bacterium]
EGTLLVEHEGSVVQVNDLATATNLGSITVSKLTPNLGPKGFMILGSPMSEETREGVYGLGRRVLKHRTDLFVPNGAVGGTTENFVDDNNNNWEIKNGALALAEGYLVKPQPRSNPPTGGQFVLDYSLGTLNNGSLRYNLLYNGSRVSSPNMLGNPYASAIDLDVFLPANPLIDAVYYWQHITPPTQTFPGFNQLNFNLGDISVYNQGSGGVEAQNGGGIPTRYMASGQGFGVKALGAGLAVFNNSMRVTGPNTDYRRPENEDRQRIWLRLKSEAYDYISSSMLVAFTEGATDGFEGIYDSRRFDTPISLFSVLDTEEELAIQGRTAFNEEQEVQLGFSTMVEEASNYAISISQIEGEEISNSIVYLFDSYLNVYANLSEENYVFTSDANSNTDRFVLLFKERALGTNDLVLQSISMLPNPTTGMLTVNSPNTLVEQIDVIDVRGRLVSSKQYNNSSQYLVDLSSLESAMYFVKLYTSEGTITKRIIRK